MAALAQLQREVDERLRCGEPFPQIERDLIEPCDLSEEDKSVLWLYCWTHLDDGPLGYQQRQRPVLNRAVGRLAVFGADA